MEPTLAALAADDEKLEKKEKIFGKDTSGPQAAHS